MSASWSGKGIERRRATDAAHRAAVEGTVAHMRRCLAEPLDLNTLSRFAAMSKFHFVRTFEEVTGTTPCRFLGCLRIERAKQLLLQTNADVTDICMTVGYSSLGSFSSAFAELVGVPPSAFRRLPREIDAQHFFGRVAAFLDAQQRRKGPFLTGQIEAPVASEGVVYVGAFVRGVPQGVPESGTVVLAPGEYRIPRPSAPAFHLLAVLLPYGVFSLPLSTLIAVAGVASTRVVTKSLDCARLPQLTFRPPRPTDPPILVELSALL